jgi:hypothetical protein
MRTEKDDINTIKYIGISKNKSLRFKKHTYLISIEKRNSLIFGEKLTFGYLSTGYSVGSKRGWFKSIYSMTEIDFNNYWILNDGFLKTKQINLVII